jgi:hypothetical protein
MNTVTAARTSTRTAGSSGRALTSARYVSMALAAVVAVSATAGLAARGVYHDADAVVALLRGYDLVALVVAAPLLAAALLRRTSRGLLVWAGVLVYAAYNYAYYLFGTQLNALFGLHAAVVVLAVAGLVRLLAGIDVRAIAAGYGGRTPVRSMGGVLLVLGVALATMWSFGVVRALAAGSALDEPSQLIVPAAFTHLGAALDLAVLVPGYAIAGLPTRRVSRWTRALGDRGPTQRRRPCLDEQTGPCGGVLSVSVCSAWHPRSRVYRRPSGRSCHHRTPRRCCRCSRRRRP